ncbi:hypothetical protein B0H21DRAFT_725062 [Amylocystis lapponica]|nr:hypothetical protein B0H21DRAFT_725062 [Amylocystis lapponica]
MSSYNISFPKKSTRAPGDCDSPTWTVLQVDDESEEDELLAFTASQRKRKRAPASASARVQRSADGRAPPDESAEASGSSSSAQTLLETSSSATVYHSANSPGPSSGPFKLAFSDKKQKRPKRARTGKAAFEGVVITRPPPSNRRSYVSFAHADDGHNGDARSSPATHTNHDAQPSDKDGVAELIAALTFAFEQNCHADPGREAGPPARVVRPVAPEADSSGMLLRGLRQPALTNVHGSTAFWRRVDAALDTRVAAVSEGGAQEQLRGEQAESLQRHQLRFVLQKPETRMRRGSGWTPYSTPRWSQASMFKERLDRAVGPGSIMRGLGRRPQAMSSEGGEEGTEDGTDSPEDADRHRRKRRRGEGFAPGGSAA